MAKNTGLVGKDTSVFSGGEVIERQGRRKHWRQFPDEDEGITADRTEIMVEAVERELFRAREVDIVREELENGKGGNEFVVWN